MTRLRWGEGPDDAEVITGADALEQRLRDLARGHSVPVIVVLEGLRGYDVSIGLSGTEATVTIITERDTDGLATEHVALGDQERDGHAAFMLLGSHHTELPSAQLMPLHVALRMSLRRRIAVRCC